MVTLGGQCSSWGTGWRRTPVFLRLALCPNSRETSAKQDVMQCLLSVGNEGSVVRKEVSDQPILALGVCLDVPQIEEAAIQTVPDKHPTIIIQIINCLRKPHVEDAKESECQDTPSFTRLVMGKGFNRSPLSLIWPLWFSCSWTIICINFWGQPSHFRNSHSCSMNTIFLGV